jgi:hypothetical protein
MEVMNFCGVWGRLGAKARVAAGIETNHGSANLGSGRRLKFSWSLGAVIESIMESEDPTRNAAIKISTGPHVEAGGGMCWSLRARLAVIHWSLGAHTNN